MGASIKIDREWKSVEKNITIRGWSNQKIYNHFYAAAKRKNKKLIPKRGDAFWNALRNCKVVR